MLKEFRGNQDSKEYIMAGLGDHTDQWGMGPVGEFGTTEKGGNQHEFCGSPDLGEQHTVGCVEPLEVVP